MNAEPPSRRPLQAEAIRSKEFQRLKEDERRTLDWDVRRNLATINYRIHTDAIKGNLIPPELTRAQASHVYANEADVLNVALFGTTAKPQAEIGTTSHMRSPRNREPHGPI